MRKDFGVRVDCRIGEGFCGRCCLDTEMPLTEEDVKRIECLGYSREEFSVIVDGIRRLRNVNGRCYFLDESNGCKIYEHRPIGCRIYPVVLDPDSGKAIVDRLCPKWKEVRIEDVRRVEKILRELVRRIYSIDIPL